MALSEYSRQQLESSVLYDFVLDYVPSQVLSAMSYDELVLLLSMFDQLYVVEDEQDDVEQDDLVYVPEL